MAKKILIFSTAYHPFVGGAEVAVKEITDRITDIEFDLITARFDAKLPKFEKVGNVDVYRIGFGLKTIDKLLLPFLGALKVLTLGRKNKYFCYWCVMVSFASGAAYIANFFNRPKIPIILTLQEGDSEAHLLHRWFGLINMAWRLALKKASIVTAISRYLAIRAYRVGYKGDVKIIPNGVNVKLFTQELTLHEKENIRHKFGFNKEDVVLVTASRLVSKNGIGDVIKALALLPKNIKFLVLGSGPLETELVNLSNYLDVKKRIVFNGYVDINLIPKYFKSSDIFIRPSLFEGFGNSFIEAMASKISVIATPVGGINDFLFEGKTGYLCRIESPYYIAKTVKEVISDSNRHQIIENAYRMVVEKYDWDLVAKKMQEVFKTL